MFNILKIHDHTNTVNPTDLPPVIACPMCNTGSDLSIYADVNEHRVYAYHVGCGICGARGRNRFPIGWCETPLAAIEAWNYRGAVRPVALMDTSEREQFSIENENSGKYILYLGRSPQRHGLNLCTLGDFDSNGEAVRSMIVSALNAVLPAS